MERILVRSPRIGEEIPERKVLVYTVCIPEDVNLVQKAEGLLHTPGGLMRIFLSYTEQGITILSQKVGSLI